MEDNKKSNIQTYEFTAPNGQIVEIDSETEPTSEQVKSVFKEAGLDIKPRTFGGDLTEAVDTVFNLPKRASESAFKIASGQTKLQNVVEDEINRANRISSLAPAGAVAGITAGMVMAPVATVAGLSIGALSRTEQGKKQITAMQNVLKDHAPIIANTILPAGIEQSKNFLLDAAQMSNEEQFQGMISTLGELGIGSGIEGALVSGARLNAAQMAREGIKPNGLNFGFKSSIFGPKKPKLENINKTYQVADFLNSIRIVDPHTGATRIPARGVIKRGKAYLDRMYRGRLNSATLKRNLINKAEQRGYIASEEIDKAFEPAFAQQAGKLNNEIDTLMKDMDTAIGNEAKGIRDTTYFIKEELPKFAKRNSVEYVRNLDEVSETLAVSDKPLTQGQVNDMIENSINELGEEGAVTSMSTPHLKKMQAKFVERREILDDAGKGTGEYELTNPDGIVDFAKFNTARKGLTRTVQTSKLTGAQRFSTEDLGYILFNKNWGEFVAEQVPGFRNLQEAYKPILQSTKMIWKNAKPGQMETKGLETFLERASKNELSFGEQEAMKIVEQGTERFGTGIGNVTDKLIANKSRIDTLKDAAKKLEEINQQQTKSGIAKLEAAKQSAKDKATQAIVTPRKTRIENRSMQIERLKSGAAFRKTFNGQVLREVVRASLILGMGEYARRAILGASQGKE